MVIFFEMEIGSIESLPVNNVEQIGRIRDGLTIYQRLETTERLQVIKRWTRDGYAIRINRLFLLLKN